MRIWNRLAPKAGAYWRLTLFPVGTVINAWGNLYYNTPYRYQGLVLFLVGGAIAFYGLWGVDSLPLWDILAVRFGTPKWRNLRGNIRLLLGAAVPLIFLHHARFSIGRVIHGAAQPGDYELTAGVLVWIWIMLSCGVSSVEPKDAPFERLPGRITRAARVRVVANWAGVVAAGLYFYPRLLSAYPAQAVSLGVTFAVALIVTMHKVYARVRKLCTQVHAASQTLRRDLDELAAADPAAPATSLQSAARRSWDSLSRALHTRLDSGYPRFGVPFLREDVVTDLGTRILAAIDAMPGEPDAGKQVHEDLAAIITACSERIDVVA